MSDDIRRSAGLSDDGIHRYWLRREWREQAGGGLLWIMLNPSTADGLEDDATIRKCMGFARKWGYGAMHVVNLFSYRSTDPKWLSICPNPVGPDNDRWIAELSSIASGIVAGWGDSGPQSVRERAVAVHGLIGNRQVACIGMTKTGMPCHPSRPGYATPLSPYWSAAEPPATPDTLCAGCLPADGDFGDGPPPMVLGRHAEGCSGTAGDPAAPEDTMTTDPATEEPVDRSEMTPELTPVAP